MASSRKRETMRFLLNLIDEAYDRRAWHGTNLRGSVRGLSARQAAWRPGPRRHNIWEIVVHCAYWKYIVRRRILGEKRGSFPLRGSNWFKQPKQLTEKDWKKDIALLESCHVSMRKSITRFNDADLPRRAKGSKITNAAILRGIASHDLYHAGQIQLLKRLHP